MSELSRIRVETVKITSQKTVSELLAELGMTHDHVVLLAGKRLKLNDILNEDDSVIVLPTITGG
ncbi:MAG: MoaD/ThiS family protein [Candidatus Thorarchaeota archaeon]|nr:MoaD/ThiS family protein [Candidatus Thorarchaeota archaeon]